MTSEQAAAIAKLQKDIAILKQSFFDSEDMDGAETLADILLQESDTLEEEIEAFE